MRATLVLTSVCLMPSANWACARCAPLVQGGVFNADFLSNAALLMAPLALIGVISAAVHRWDASP